MTKIKKYPIKIPVASDFVTGSDSETADKETVNFRFEDILSLLNTLNGNEVISYVFSESEIPELDENGYGYFLSENNQTSPDNVTKLIVSKKTKSLIDLSALFNFMITHKDDFVLELSNISDPNNFAYFQITDISEEEFQYTFTLSIEGIGNFLGLLINESLYNFVFNLKTGSSFKVIGIGETLIFKNPINNIPSNKNVLEIGDVGQRFIETGVKIEGVYLGGNPNLEGSWRIQTEIEP